ncbi:MAG: FAD-binding oxidoreductase [Microbacteriaceae bacterium]|nr:FAD-binding oxidoreductase [Microbacteriaceae bacterium]
MTTRTIVIGAGIVGLSTAWHLQERGHEVTVVDRAGIAAGSSWGNAGWLAPGKTIPLADPSLWRTGLVSLLDPDAALRIPLRLDPGMWSFLIRFAAHGTNRAWDRAMAALTPIDRIALAAYDELAAGGIEAPVREGPYVIGFAEAAQSRGFEREIAGAVRHGQDVPLEKLDEPRELAPQLSEQVRHAFRLDGQRWIEPGPYVEALGAAVAERGATMRLRSTVVDVAAGGPRPVVVLADHEHLHADRVVIATGAWLPALARRLGVRTRVQAGRGYSFTVPVDEPARHPVYLPFQRIACTPYEGRFRIAGTMEFRRPDDPPQPRRIRAIVAQARAMLTGIDLDDRRDEWVGARPVTPDGLPLVGATRDPRVFVAGGHGMWGVVLGPATGRLLAERIDTGRTPAEIAPFDPLR